MQARFHIILGGFIGLADALCDDGGCFVEHSRVGSMHAPVNTEVIQKAFDMTRRSQNVNRVGENDQIRVQHRLPDRVNFLVVWTKRFAFHETKLAAPTIVGRVFWKVEFYKLVGL